MTDPLRPPETDEEPWAWLESQPGFNERMERGKADLLAGRSTRLRDLYPTEAAYRVATAWQSPHRWLIAALVAVLALIAWRTRKP